MADGAENGHKGRPWLRVLLAAIAILLIALFLPPFIGISHYKNQITRLMAQSLGRPVRVSSVEARLLPWPGFVLYDLSVAEDPAYGVEPVLHASRVTASIRLLSLLRGRVQIGAISVDDASLNVVRAAAGRWNLDPLFRTAAAQAGSIVSAKNDQAIGFPSIEATDSRIDFKDGVEKLPFSLVNADISFWQSSPGDWRIRLRGQPARTDVSLYLEDTGIVRMEATVRRAPELSQMPLHIDLDWREAQLGQLARLITGSDPGWRGDLTGELHLDGTADAANIAMRLRAAGVHQTEFVPTAPLDFDANCNFVYHYSQRSVRNVACDSPLGDGHIHLTGDKPGSGAPAAFTVALDRVPVSAGLDALRTLRSGIQPDLAATGTVSGKLIYAPTAASTTPPESAKSASARATHAVHIAPVAHISSSLPGPLTGSLIVENLSVTSGGLTHPLQSPRITLVAGASPRTAPITQPPVVDPANSLDGSVAISAGGAVPLTLGLRFSLSGYEVAIRGQAAIARAREIAHAAGIPVTAALQSLAGEPIAVDLVAAGPWLAPEQFVLPSASPSLPPIRPSPQTRTDTPGTEPAASPAAALPMPFPTSDTLSGAITLRNANWKADFLANHLNLSVATLHFSRSGLRWDPVVFAYGPIEGTASLILPPGCPQQEFGVACPAPLPPTFHVDFGNLNAASFQTALLGAHEPGTLLSTLLDRIHPASAPAWPRIEGTINADSLVLGPVTLKKISAAVGILPDGAEVSSLAADLLGGRLRASGTLHRPTTEQDKPSYLFACNFDNLDASNLGELLGLRWTGSPVAGNGKVELSGYTSADLAASAKGSLHLETRRGAIDTAQIDPANGLGKPPAALNRFDRWTADATISAGTIQLGSNQVVSAGRTRSIEATVTFGDPLTVSFEPPVPRVAKR